MSKSEYDRGYRSYKFAKDGDSPAFRESSTPDEWEGFMSQMVEGGIVSDDRYDWIARIEEEQRIIQGICIASLIDDAAKAEEHFISDELEEHARREGNKNHD